jgi:SAM-dependent methyltransferase
VLLGREEPDLVTNDSLELVPGEGPGGGANGSSGKSCELVILRPHFTEHPQNGSHADQRDTDLMSPSSRDTSWIGHEFDRRAAIYDHSEMHRWQADQAVQLLQPQPAQRILDIATGTGLAARACARITHAPQQIVGIDISHGMLQAAAAVSTSSYLQADAAQLPFRPATFDALLCVATIPYLPDLAKALTEWRRVAQPSADLVFTTPAADGIATLRLIRQAAADHGLALSDHASLGTADQIADTLDNLGLVLRQVEERTFPDSLDAAPRAAYNHWLEYGFPISSTMHHGQLLTPSTTATSPLIVSCKPPAPANTSPCSRGAPSRADRDTRTWSRTTLRPVKPRCARPYGVAALLCSRPSRAVTPSFRVRSRRV